MIKKIKLEKLEKVYNKCEAEGIIKNKKEVDVYLAKSMLISAKNDLIFAKKVEKMAEEESNFSVLFKFDYDILRQLVDALALFQKIKSSNHKCILAYTCMKHPKFNLDWETLETMRKLRNRVQYEGLRINKDIWQIHKIKFEIYISNLMKILEKKVSRT